MIGTPQIIQSEARHTAGIRLTMPRADIQKVMGPAIGDKVAAVGASELRECSHNRSLG